MTYPSLALPTAVIGGDNSAAVQNNVYSIINALRNPPEAVGRLTSAATLTTSTWTLFQLNAEDFDNGALYDGAMHDNVTNNSRIMITTPGRYVVWGGVAFATSGTGRRLVQIRKNAGGSAAGGSEMAYFTYPPASSGVSSAIIPYGFLQVVCVNGDYFEMFGYQDTGGNLAVDTTGDKGGNFLAARMIGT